jgi:hypothetical protein
MKSSSSSKHIGRLLVANAVATVALCAQPTAQPKSVTDAKKLVDRSGKLQPGDISPDFNLKVMHKEVQVALSGFRGERPVALVFGSYT